MNMKKTDLISFAFIGMIFFLFPVHGYAQAFLKERLEGRNTLNEIMAVVDDYYRGKPDTWRGYEGNLPRYKHWKRWEWYMAVRLGPDGAFTDIKGKNLEAYQSITNSHDRTINNFWQFVGPSSIDGFGLGRVDRIAFHPTDTSTYYAGSSGGGLWKTTNDGTSWTPLTDFIASLGVSGIVVNWADPNDIYILTGDGDSDLLGGFVDLFDFERKSAGVYKSSDAGATWIKMAALDTMAYLPFQLAQSPFDADVLLAATSIGIYWTFDGGNSWNKTKSGEFHDVEYKPGTNRAYASGLPGVFYSSNGGLTWVPSALDSAILNPRRLEVAVTPANVNHVYLLAASSDTATGRFCGFYRSTDSGVSFQERSNSPNILGRDNTNGQDTYQQARYTHTMTVSSETTNRIVTGAVYSWRSANGGLSWVHASGPHPDHHMVAYNPLNGSVYSANDGGIYKSVDNGVTWVSKVNNLEASQIYHMAGTSANSNYLLCGLQDNGVIQRDGNTSDFDELLYLDGFMLTYAPGKTDTMYVGGNGDIWRSYDGGVTMDSIGVYPADSLEEFFGIMLTRATSDAVLFGGFSDIFRSTNRGTTWSNRGAEGNWAMANCPSNLNRYYAAGSPTYGPSSKGRLWRSDDGGLTWDSLHTNPGFPPITSGTRITDIAVNPTNSSRVYVTIGGFNSANKIMRSFFAGAGWEDWTGSIPNVPITSVAVDSSENVYVGTDIGVFYRTQAMSDWMPYKNGFPNVPVTDIVLQEAQDRLLCATFGRGVWRNTLVEACPGNMMLSGTISGYRLYQATDFITSTNTIPATENAYVHLQAGNYIRLLPHFRATRTSTFSARISQCGGGGIPLVTSVEEDR